jgi:hypothetical protein
VGQTVNSDKQKIGPAEALKLLDGVKTLVCVIRGKNIVTFDLTKNRPDDATLTAHMIGPTGNLRAPTVRVGNVMVVGYNEEAYRRVLGD